MTYYQQRRAELLGSRKRKPRRCDVLRRMALERKRAAVRQGTNQYRAGCVNRLWRALYA